MSSGPLRLSGPSTFCCCVTRGAARPLAEHKVISLALTRIIAPLVKTCHLSAHLHEGNLRRAPVTSHPVPACLSKQPALPKQSQTPNQTQNPQETPQTQPNKPPPQNPPDPFAGSPRPGRQRLSVGLRAAPGGGGGERTGTGTLETGGGNSRWKSVGCG